MSITQEEIANAIGAALKINWRLDLASNIKTYEKDWQRLVAFEAAAQQKLTGLIMATISDPENYLVNSDTLRAFATGFRLLAKSYGVAGGDTLEKIRKFQPFKWLTSSSYRDSLKNPFAKAVVAAKAFIVQWDLGDQEFKTLMGM